MRLSIFVLCLWLITGITINIAFNAYVERNSFTIDGGKSVYRCREITK